ncbi:DUF393 domain-containing protein [Leptolyngbya sp. FACHB-261]|nr:DUF393 domain-containing protein [Leptolyngbya sp. FACHB-261]
MTVHSPKKNLFASKLGEIFSLDLRSLALFRMGLALVILADLGFRARSLTAHYSDVGVLPRTALIGEVLKPWYWSIHLISGQPLVQALLFGVAGLIALALLVGYQTRLATIASWALVVSLHNRNPALIFAADDVLRALLFWAMFLPLGARYSIDSALNTANQRQLNRWLSGATVALIFQQCFIYWFSAAFKSESPVWLDGSAVYYALSYDQYVTGLGQILLGFPLLLSFSTLTTFALEWVGPFLLFMPVRTDFFRSCAVVTFILLHIGFGLTLNLGIFPMLSVFSWLAFIPSSVWDRLSKRLYTPERIGLKIYYDGDCGFCKKVVHLLRTFLILPETPLEIAQSDPSIEADMQAYNSWVVVDWQNHRHFKFEAIAYICSLSPLFAPLAHLLRWKPAMAAGTRFYETIAVNRKAAGRFTAPLQFRSLEVRPSKPANLAALLLLAYLFVWNLRSLSPSTFNRKALNSVDWIGRLLRLDQNWSIFAPSPPKDDGWYVMPAKLKDGTEVDLLTKNSASWDKPNSQLRSEIYQNMQWRTYLINLNRSIGEKLYPYYAQYLCRNWNSQHRGKQEVANLEIYFMSERTVAPGQTQNVERKRTWQQSCTSDSMPDAPEN